MLNRKKSLTIGMIQDDVHWHNAKKNIKKFEKIIFSNNKKVDIWILPELFTTGFTMKPEEVYESMNGLSIKWMKTISKKKNAAIMGSIVIYEKKKYFNRLIFSHPNGKIEYYDKHHLFTLIGENKVYKCGNKKLLINFYGWKIRPLICYDLRFPVWSRNIDNYDILIIVAQWPKNRILAWDSLLKARAIENMSYCIGLNRTGKDKHNLKYNGHSAAYDYLGNKLSYMSNKKAIKIIKLNKEKLDLCRKELPFLNDKDNFVIN